LSHCYEVVVSIFHLRASQSLGGAVCFVSRVGIVVRECCGRSAVRSDSMFQRASFRWRVRIQVKLNK